MNNLILKRFISTSIAFNAGKAWRIKNGLPKLQTGLTSLIDLPDYSFLDGRPTPLGVGQRKRKELQQNLCREMMEGLDYIKYGKENYEMIRKNLLNEKQNSIENKLINKNIEVKTNTGTKTTKSRRRKSN